MAAGLLGCWAASQFAVGCWPACPRPVKVPHARQAIPALYYSRIGDTLNSLSRNAR